MSNFQKAETRPASSKNYNIVDLSKNKSSAGYKFNEMILNKDSLKLNKISI